MNQHPATWFLAQERRRRYRDEATRDRLLRHRRRFGRKRLG
jgi:hypothetical protein